MFNWNQPNVAELTLLWNEGLSGTKIADEMGHKLTRNAVIGKANRLGLRRERKAQSSAPSIRKPRTAPVAKQRAMAILTQAAVASAPMPGPAVITSEYAVPFMRVENHECHWPLWTGDEPIEERFYCGTPTANVLDGHPYCGPHSRMAFDGLGRGARPYHALRAAE